MRSRCMSLLPRTTLHSDSEQVLPIMYRVYVYHISDLETVKLTLGTLILEFGTAKPSSAVPVGRTVKVYTNIQLARIG
jgi:hypothetical protein